MDAVYFYSSRIDAHPALGDVHKLRGQYFGQFWTPSPFVDHFTEWTFLKPCPPANLPSSLFSWFMNDPLSQAEIPKQIPKLFSSIN